MSLQLFLHGVLMGLVVAVPVGRFGLFCINRALMLGALYRLFSGSALWWVALVGTTAFRNFFSLRFLFWGHNASGMLIALFGLVVLASLSSAGRTLGLAF